MRIDSPKKIVHTFKQVKPGEVFKTKDGNYFLRIFPSRECFYRCAVNLKNGMVSYFEDDYEVALTEGSFVTDK